jgi:hypothetical protein
MGLPTFEDLVLANAITDRGLRSMTDARIITALKEAHGWGESGGLTPEERGILHCLILRAEHRADRPADDGLDYAGTTGLLGWALRITLDDPRIAERQSAYRAVVAGFRQALDGYLKHAAAEEDD